MSKRKKYSNSKRKVRYTSVMSRRFPLYLSSHVKSKDTVNDLRRFHPDATIYYQDDGRPTSFYETSNGKNVYTNFRKRSFIAFRDTRKVTVCHRRKIRREVLFKLNKVGKGKKVSNKRLFTDRSNIICR